MKKLRYKGDSDKKRTKRKRKHEENSLEAAEEEDDQHNEDPVEAWQVCEVIPDLNGPLFIYSTQAELPAILTSYEYEKPSFRKPKVDIENPIPTIVSQVFVVRLTHPGSQRISIKSCNDKFMGCDAIGGVTCERDALGPSEQWEIVQVEGGFSFKSHFGGYLKFDRKDAVSVPCRADSTEIGLLETFSVKCQAINKTTYVKKEAKEKKNAQIEFDRLKMFQSYNTSSFGERDLKRTKEDLKLLKDAKEAGKLAETLLDRRSKSKSDRFC